MFAATFSFVTDFFDWLEGFANNWWFLAIIALIAYLDSVIPVVPSETMVIIGGVTAASKDGVYPVIAVIAAGAIGAFLGDNSAYLIGRRLSAWFIKRAERNPKFAKRLAWADEQIEERGGLLLITARFIPGGRTILTLSSGITEQPKRWFVKWIAIACVIWGCYAALLGAIGGKTFEDNHTKAFIFAFGLAISATVIIEIVRHFINKRKGVAH
jgi:membrane-associated protein